MLTALSIRDVVLIEALDLEFGAGLDVLTGETGAGKSILLDALGLALGGRGESGLVRHGAAQAIVTATFDPPVGALGALLEENGVEVEPGEPLLVRRIVKADGGSRALVNNQPAGVALLREMAPMLVEIHGQHDEQAVVLALVADALAAVLEELHGELADIRVGLEGGYGGHDHRVAAGIAQVDSITNSVSYVSGEYSVALIREIAQIPLSTLGLAAEQNFVFGMPSLPRIYDGAALYWLWGSGVATPANSAFSGYLNFVWG